VIAGRYFFPNSARTLAARAEKVAGTLRITTLDGERLAEAPFRSVQITPRLAALPRRLLLPDGGCFETADNDGVDAMIGAARHLLGGGWMDRVERSWRAVMIAIVLAAAAGAAFVIWGLPASAKALAAHSPEWLSVSVSEQAIETLDKHYLLPTRLTDAEQQRAQRLFDHVAAAGACDGHHCVLLFRQGGPPIGANAFALPDGHIVLTDQLMALVRADDELQGVFAHEMGHIVYAHALQRVYQASLLPAAIAVVTGDVSQVSQIAVILPGILIQSAYSRAFETEADLYAVATLKRMAARPAALADLLERLEKQHCGAKGCGPSWIGDHPDTASRAKQIRSR
jgi:Zn-dependent protease with chaperone function